MHRFAIAISTLISLILFGCSQQGNPVDGQGSNSNSRQLSDRKISDVITPKAPDYNIISISKSIKANDGGNIRLQGTYTDKGRDIYFDVSLYIPTGGLSSNQTITVSIDKRTFSEDALVTFGPHGILFNKPATLTVYANGSRIARENKELAFYYVNNGVWERMPNAWGASVSNNGGNVYALASIPHFSQYAFGRRAID